MRVFKNSFLLLFLSLASVIGGCRKEPHPSTDGRVVIVYMAANNNLAYEATKNIEDLKRGYLPSKEDGDVLLVYTHQTGKNPTLDRYSIDGGSVAVDRLIEYESSRVSITEESIRETLLSVQFLYPNKEYGLILWSHSTGWMPEGAYNSFRSLSSIGEDPHSHLVKSFGAENGRELNIEKLEQALPYKFSFILFDACLMGGVEVIYQLKEKADYIIASPTEVLAAGYPYQHIMDPLFRKRANLKEVCQHFYNSYDTLVKPYRSATVALYKTSALSNLAEACYPIFSEKVHYLESLDKSLLQPYFTYGREYFWDFDRYLSVVATDSQLREVRRALDEVVVMKWSTEEFITIDIEHFSGISSYIPSMSRSTLNEYYSTLSWSRDIGLQF